MRAAGRSSLARRLLVGYTLTVVAVLAVLAFALDRTIESALLDDLTESLAEQGRVVRVALPQDAAQQPVVERLGEELTARITVIASDGTVLADSLRDPATMENHAGRPEVRAALRGEIGVASRTSETTGDPYRYVALPASDGIVVRVALPLSVVAERLGRVRSFIIAGTVLAAAVGVTAVWLVARGLTRPLREMTSSVEELPSGETKVPEDGPKELALLGETINRMSAELEARLEELSRDRGRLDDILSAMSEGVLLVGSDGQIGYANSAAHRLLGDVSQWRGLSPFLTLLEEARTASEIKQRDVEHGLPPAILRCSAVPLEETDEVLIVIRDVTAEKHVEAMRRDFVADASHELKTPAAAMQAAAETLERAIGEDPAAASRFASQLRSDTVRLSRMVTELLDLSRLESEPADLEPVRLDQVVAEEVDRLRPRAEESGVVLRWEGAPVTVSGSTKDLSLLARNLLENAVRFTREGGQVSVEVRGSNGSATLRVSDTGIGIPTRDLPRIFERFYRVDRARSRETGGTGLGLSIARHVVERHGGQIEAESELGRGSTFRVTLPTGTS